MESQPLTTNRKEQVQLEKDQEPYYLLKKKEKRTLDPQNPHYNTTPRINLEDNITGDDVVGPNPPPRGVHRRLL